MNPLSTNITILATLVVQTTKLTGLHVYHSGNDGLTKCVRLIQYFSFQYARQIHPWEPAMHWVGEKASWSCCRSEQRGNKPYWQKKQWSVNKSNDSVQYYLHNGPKHGFMHEELLVVPPNTELPPSHYNPSASNSETSSSNSLSSSPANVGHIGMMYLKAFVWPLSSAIHHFESNKENRTLFDLMAL